MRLISLRHAALGAAALVVAGAVAAPALAWRGQGADRRGGAGFDGPGIFAGRGGFGPGGGQGPVFGPSGFGGPGLGGLLGGPFGHGGPRGAGVFGLDVLTPAASFLGISVDTLVSDLKGGKTLAQEATAKGKSPSDLVDVIVAAEKKILDNEVAAGWITNDQETALVNALEPRIADLVNNGPGVPPARPAPRQSLLQTASDFLGISVPDLQSDLRSGKTLADEAASKGKSVSDLVAALVAPTKAQLDARVKDGTITQAQEDAIVSRLTARLTDVVNGKAPAALAGLRIALATSGVRLSIALG